LIEWSGQLPNIIFGGRSPLPRIRAIVNGTEVFSGSLDIANHPKTVNELLRARTVKTIAVLRGDYYMFRVPVRVGAEKPESAYKEGDLAFDFMGGWLLLFKKRSMYAGRANYVGALEGRVPDIKPGTEIVLVFTP